MGGLRIGLGVGIGSGNRLPPYVDMQFLYEGFNVAETPYTFNQLISFTRTSAATYVNSAGNIVTTSASKNLLTFTEEFDNATWTKSNATALPFGPATATLGAECVANGDFASGASWSGPVAGATITGGALVFDGVTSINGSITSNTQTIPIVAGRWYAATYTIIGGTTNGFSLNLGGALGTPRTAAGTYTEYLFATTTTAVDISARGGAAIRTGSIDNVSVREVIGGLITAPDGTLTADTLVPNNGASDGQTTQIVASALASTAYAYSFYVKSAGLTSARFRLTARTAGNVFISDLQVDADLSAGTIGAVASGTFTGTSASITSVGNGWYRVSLIGTTPATTAILWASVRYPPAGDGTSGLYIWGAQLETGSTATAYVRNFGGLFPPRFNYDPVTLQPRGLLIEEQRTNLLLRSEEFDNAAWTKTRSSVTANAAVSPDGTMDADKLVEDTTATATHRTFQQATKAASSLTRTFSVYLKASERTFARVQVSDNTEVVVARTDIDLSAGTATAASIAGGSSISAVSARISPAGNGWYRVELTATFDATITNPGAFVFLCNSLSGISYTGNGASGIFVWGAQWEDGSFATSYIPTVASQVTRTADQASIVAPNFAPWYNQSEGTFVVEADSLSPVDIAVRFAAASADAPATSRNTVFLYNGKWGSSARVSGTDQCDLQQNGSYTANVAAKIAFAYKANDFAASVNGAAALTDASGSVPTVDRLLIGGNGITNILNGHIRRIAYYPSRLSNAQLQALSA